MSIHRPDVTCDFYDYGYFFFYSDMASAVLTTSRLPEEYHHSGGGNAAAGVETAASSSNHSSPTGSHDLSRNSPEHRPNSTDNHNPPPPYLQPDRREETSSSADGKTDKVPALLQPTADGVKTEALSYHGSLSGRSTADIPSVVESEAEPYRGASAAGGSNRDHGEMLLEKLEREFQTASAPKSLFGSGGGDNSSDRLGTPPGLQIVMPTDPDVSINSSSGKVWAKLEGKWGVAFKAFHVDSYRNLKSNLSFYLEDAQILYDYARLMMMLCN